MSAAPGVPEPKTNTWASLWFPTGASRKRHCFFCTAHTHCELTDTSPQDYILGLSAAPPGLSTPEPGVAGPPEAVLPQVGTGSTVKGRVERRERFLPCSDLTAQAGSCSGLPAGALPLLPLQPVLGYEMFAEC